MAPFLNVPVGRNTLAGMMKTMALEGSLDNTVTNHSLRAYGVTKMFQCQVPKKLIMEHSGYRSLQGLRQYERTTDSQEMHVCQILDSTKREYSWPSMIREVSHRQPLSQQTSSAPAFSGCSFTHCTFQIALPPQRRLLQTSSQTWTLLTSFTFNSISIYCTFLLLHCFSYTVLLTVLLAVALHCTLCCYCTLALFSKCVKLGVNW